LHRRLRPLRLQIVQHRGQLGHLPLLEPELPGQEPQRASHAEAAGGEFVRPMGMMEVTTDVCGTAIVGAAAGAAAETTAQHETSHRNLLSPGLGRSAGGSIAWAPCLTRTFNVRPIACRKPGATARGPAERYGE